MQLTFIIIRSIIKKRFLSVLFFLIYSTAASFAQTVVSNTFHKNFPQYNDTLLQEKVFAHTDKNFYLTGEMVWFKLYCVEGISHQPLDVSKVAYVELSDENNKPVLQAKIALEKGEGNGSFYLPASIRSGNYRFRAYTNWMKNFGAAAFFERAVTIFNPLKNEPVNTQVPLPSYTIDFFPEGGDLVKGLPGKVAFKITDQYGKGVDGKGIIIDETNDTVVRFQPLKFGIGNFVFTPAANHHYKAVITLPNNQVMTKELPAVDNEGYNMSVSHTNNNTIKVTVQSTYANETVYLVAHHNNFVTTAVEAAINNGSTVFNLDKSSLGKGITQLTVFNAAHQPVCERLYFIRPLHYLSIDAGSDAAQYSTRKDVTIQVMTKDSAGAPAPSSLSMSVYKLDSLQWQDGSNILNYLWLTADLKGMVEAPDYYITYNDAEAEEAADNLMLTHGWRRFHKEDTTGNKNISLKFPPEYYGHIVTGKVIDIRTGKPAEDVLAYLSVPGKQPKFYTAKSDDSGYVQFNVKDNYGAGELVLQTENQTDNIYRIELFNPYSEAYSHSNLPPFYLSKNQQQVLLNYSVDMQVQNIYAKDSMARFDVPATDSLPFYGHADYSYLLDDYTRFTTMEEVLREYVREINIRKREGKLQMVILDEPRRNVFLSNSLVLLDGVPVFDQSAIFSYDPLKVRKLDVIPRKFYSGYAAFDGIAAFTTYNGNLEGLRLDPNAIVLDDEGLQLQREFYSPIYQTEQQVKSRLPDFRNTLYWSPTIKTDAQGKKLINFYTSDQKGKYVGVLQGIDDKGNAAYQTFTFEVK